MNNEQTVWKTAFLLTPATAFDSKQVIKLEHKFWQTVVKPVVVQNVFVAEQAAKRLSNSQTKTRAQVSGSNRKPWKQKGTGRARHGSRRSPIWVGGGVAFGPTNQINHRKKVNRKVYRQALAALLTEKAREKNVFLTENVVLKTAKTKLLLQQLAQWNCSLVKTKILWIASQFDQNLLWSAQNLANIKLVSVNQITVFDLLNAQKLFLAKDVLEKLASRLKLC